MNVKTNAEKEWLRKLTTGQPTAKEEVKVPQMAAETQLPIMEPKKNGCHGFADVAGMDELKQMVKEGFINVLNNQECAKAFGITPPSLLFNGPAGCGKTYFAEKIAEEVGINFMKNMRLEVLKYKKSLIYRDLVQITPSCLELFIRGHFPMQKCLKIFSSTSLGVMEPPVMSARWSRQMRRSSHIKSPLSCMFSPSMTRLMFSCARHRAS